MKGPRDNLVISGVAVLFALAASIASAAPGAHLIVDVSGVPQITANAPVPALPAEAMSAAQKIYGGRCALCHGATGQGDGPGAGGLPVQPRRHTDALWQASVTDDDIAAVIVNGGPARKLSILMPANPDLKDEPETLRALIGFIRGLRAPHGTVHVTVTGADGNAHPTSVDAAADGSARVDVGALVPGNYRVVVETAPHETACAISATVGAADVHLQCRKKAK